MHSSRKTEILKQKLTNKEALTKESQMQPKKEKKESQMQREPWIYTFWLPPQHIAGDISKHACMCQHIYAHTHIHMYMLMHTYSYIQVFIYTTNLYMHTNTNIYTYTCTHYPTHIPACTYSLLTVKVPPFTWQVKGITASKPSSPCQSPFSHGRVLRGRGAFSLSHFKIFFFIFYDYCYL